MALASTQWAFTITHSAWALNYFCCGVILLSASVKLAVLCWNKTNAQNDHQRHIELLFFFFFLLSPNLSIFGSFPCIPGYACQQLIITNIAQLHHFLQSCGTRAMQCKTSYLQGRQMNVCIHTIGTTQTNI